MKDIVVRKLSLSDLDKLAQLYEDVWKDIPYDKVAKARFVIEKSEGVNYGAEVGGQIIGSRTSFFTNVYYGEQKWRCVQVGDSCVKKEYRGCGLFTKMNNAFLAEFFSEQVGGEIIYNISEEISRKAYEKLGWKYIQSYMILRNYTNIVSLLFKCSFNPKNLRGPVMYDLLTEENASVKQEYLEAREKIMRKRGLIHTFYTNEVLSWRLSTLSGIKKMDLDDFGTVFYKIGVKKNIVYVQIGELFLCEYTYATFRKAIKVLKKKLRPDILQVAVTIGHPLYDYYRKAGYQSNPTRKFLNHGVKVISDEMKAVVYCPELWAMSSIDLDTF